jgi:hypothetical protein
MIDTPSSSSQSVFTSPQGLPLATLLYLATLGGANVCNLGERIGSFTPGKEFDALLISLPRGIANPGLWYDGSVESLETMLERFFFGGDDRNIRKVWVRGRLVGGGDTSLWDLLRVDYTIRIRFWATSTDIAKDGFKASLPLTATNFLPGLTGVPF